MNIVEFRHNLVADEHGIWRTSQKYELSYPSEGNESCFELEDASFWFRHRNDCIAAAVRRFPPAGNGPIVDVGGGNGFVSKRLLDEGLSVILVEPGPAGAFNAKTHRGLPNVICATLQDAGFAPNSVPAVGLFDVLEHIEDDRAFLQLVHTVLAPDGMLYATVPAQPWLWSVSDSAAGHFRRYSQAHLRQVLSKDFELRYITPFFQLLVLPLFLLRSIPWRIGLSRRQNLLSRESEHGTRRGIVTRSVAHLLRREVDRMSRGRQMFAGTSLLVVATKR